MSKGQLITFEGGEGAGKTTLISQVAESLEKNDKAVVITREPGGSDLGISIRNWLLEKDSKVKISPLAELMLFLADRVQHIQEVIQPALDDGKIILCDRFHDSTIAYQGAGRELGIPFVSDLCYKVCPLIPNITFYLDIDPKIGLKRASNGIRDRIESESFEFHKRVCSGFFELLKQNPKRIHRIDSGLPLEKVYLLVNKLINDYVKSSS